MRRRPAPLTILSAVVALVIATFAYFPEGRFAKPVERFFAPVRSWVFEPVQLWFERVEFRMRDRLANYGRKTPHDPKLIFLAIDDASLSIDEVDLEEFFGVSEAESGDAQTLQMMGRGFPWPRAIYGRILDRLIEAGAKGVIFDLTFPSASATDAEFMAALDRHRDKAVVARSFVDGGQWHMQTLMPATDTLPSDLQDRRVGFPNFWPDHDGVVRQLLSRLQFREADGRTAPVFSLAGRGLQIVGEHELASAIDSRIMRFTGPPLTFAPRPAFEIFVPRYWRQNFRSGETFKDALVIVGGFGNWQHDEHLSPFGQMPGPELQLNAINALLHREFLEPLPPFFSFLLTLLAGAVALGIARICRSPVLRLALLLAVIAAWGAGALIFFNAGVLAPVFPPILALTVVGLLSLMHDISVERRERSRMRRTLERYVSKDVVRELIDHPATFMASLGGASRPVTVLFSDIRDYSGLSVNSTPQELVTQLNEYLTAMVDCVFQHGGTLDKFIGDAVMAVWGNTTTRGAQEDTLRAVRAAFAMREQLDRLNAQWRAAGRPDLDVGIAINHGPVIVGNIGSPQRMEYTVIGDAVNLTARMQTLTKQVSDRILLGETAAGLVREHLEVHELGAFELAGQPLPVIAYGVGKEIRSGPVQRAGRA